MGAVPEADWPPPRLDLIGCPKGAESSCQSLVLIFSSFKICQAETISPPYIRSPLAYDRFQSPSLSAPPMVAYYSMPTPPFSPNSPQLPPLDAKYPLRSTIELLDSLVTFYQRERMWVCRTRAVMEEAFDGPQPLESCTPQESALPSPSPSTPESDTQDIKPPLVSLRPKQPPSRWVCRKQGFNLMLEGISKPRRLHRTQRQLQSPDLLAKEHILHLFEKMMEDRMESCQRVNRLVRSANHAYLPSR
jgi:hypothetical protein